MKQTKSDMILVELRQSFRAVQCACYYVEKDSADLEELNKLMNKITKTMKYFDKNAI